MKRYFPIFFLILILSLSGCTNMNTISEYTKPKDKESANLYASRLDELFVNNKDFKIKIFDMDFYTYYSVNEEDHLVITELLNFLEEKDFSIDDTSTYDNIRPKFKLIVEFTEEKYVFNIYDETFSTLYPWDGIYEEDVFRMDNVPEYYNLYKFCDYVIKVSKGFEG